MEDGRQTNDEAGTHPILKTRTADACDFFVGNQLMKEIKFLGINATQQVDSWNAQMRTRADARRQNSRSSHLLVQLAGGGLTQLIPHHNGGHDLFIDKLANCNPESNVGIVEVGRLPSLPKAGLRKRHHADAACLRQRHLLLSGNSSYHQSLILLQHVLSMKAIKGVRCILAGVLMDEGLAARVHCRKLGDVVHAAIDGEPHVTGRIVPSHLIPCDSSRHRLRQTLSQTGRPSKLKP
mmetsp:Transcript_16259/g.28936  ORF Transcript_16259/g.28936 Transcript_16259/m.28936 type:complete len:237 (+) Transcript_16259:1047-1757(+)